MVFLGIINGVPRNVDDMWNLYESNVKTYGPPKEKFSHALLADIMADDYFIAGHDWFDPDISPCRIMKPTFEPPEEAVRELKEWYDTWKKRVENDEE